MPSPKKFVFPKPCASRFAARIFATAIGGVLGFMISISPACAAGPVERAQSIGEVVGGSARTPDARAADFSNEAASSAARLLADWVVASRDNQKSPFIIVDKVNAKLLLFDAQGTIRAAAPVLLGLGRGDDSPPGIGARKLATMTPAERITPAGRFVASRGENLSGQDILWVDYEAAISIHRATDLKPGLSAKDRLTRLDSASSLDNRISHGCINVSESFYDSYIRPTFAATAGIVYILPETRSVNEVFGLPPEQQAQRAVSRPGG
ncbi:hypothetical protein BH09PSE4_BH09PSE4_01960 [soil metagenome]